jgi:HSP20 family protein
MPLIQARRPSQPPGRWQPRNELEQMHEQLEHLLGSAFGDTGVWVPAVDIEEGEDGWTIEAEVPGAKRKDIDIELGDGELVIAGEIKERERVGLIRRQTRRKGRFEYRVALPGPADSDKVNASLRDGVLTVFVPKAERPGSRKVEITDDASGNGAEA